MRFPNGVVICVDFVAAVPVSGEARAHLAERILPHSVVGGIDDAIAVVVVRREIDQFQEHVGI
jgi:hypothetical protein